MDIAIKVDQNLDSFIQKGFWALILGQNSIIKNKFLQSVAVKWIYRFSYYSLVEFF